MQPRKIGRETGFPLFAFGAGCFYIAYTGSGLKSYKTSRYNPVNGGPFQSPLVMMTLMLGYYLFVLDLQLHLKSVPVLILAQRTISNSAGIPLQRELLCSLRHTLYLLCTNPDCRAIPAGFQGRGIRHLANMDHKLLTGRMDHGWKAQLI